jgi:hypothetical protein
VDNRQDPHGIGLDAIENPVDILPSAEQHLAYLVVLEFLLSCNRVLLRMLAKTGECLHELLVPAYRQVAPVFGDPRKGGIDLLFGLM